MNNTIIISNREPQQISIDGGGQVIGISKVLVNGIDVTEGSVAYVVVPTKTSELINDSGFINHEVDPTVPYYVKQISQANINNWNNKQEALVSGVNIKTINDNNILGSGNIDISTSYTAGTGIEITEENVINNTITSYDDLTDLPNIPTKTSDLLNDSGYIIADQLADVAFSGDYMDLNNTPTIPTATSDLLNDSGFITKEVNDLENYFNYDYLYNYVLPKVSDSDTNISLNGTMPDLPLNITLSPSTLTQDGTPTPSSPQDIHTISGSNKVKVEASNLFDIKNFITSRGATYTENSDGSISLTTGYATLFNQPYVFSETNISVSLSGIIDNGTATNIRVQLLNSNNEVVGEITSSTSSLLNKSACKLRFNWSTAGTFTLKNIMLNKGTTALPYTPYVSQEADIDLGYDNLLNNTATSQTLNDVEITIYDDKSIKLNGTASAGGNITLGTINFVSGQTYTISGVEGFNYNTLQLYTNSATAFPAGNRLQSYDGAVSKTALGNESCDVGLYIYSGTTYNNVRVYPQVEIGSTAHSYTEYGKAIQYCKIGNYEDRIFKNVSSDPDYSSEREDGAWYIKKNIGKVVLDGTNYKCNYMFANGSFFVYDTANSQTLRDGYKSNNVGYAKANYLENKSYTDIFTNGMAGICSSSGLGELLFNVGISTSKEDINTWLGTHNVISYYVLNTPTYTKITGTLAEQLEEVYNNLKSYNEQTNISQINNDLPFVVNATTLKSLINV